MRSAVVLGVLFGAAGSVHCAVMCGPWMAIAAPRDARLAIYHAGRLAVYVGLGFLAGAAAAAAIVAGAGRWLSLAAAALLLTVALAGSGPAVAAASSRVSRAISRGVGRAADFSRRHPFAGPLSLGALNGLLPCGLVYAAAAAALGLGSPAESVLFMAGFGAGTAPLAMASGAGLAAASARARTRLNRWTPALLVVTATLLIARALLPAAAHAH